MEQKYNEALANWKRYKYENQELKSRLHGMKTVTGSIDSSRASSQLDALNEEIANAVQNVRKLSRPTPMPLVYATGSRKSHIKKQARSVSVPVDQGDEIMAKLLLLKRRNTKQLKAHSSNTLTWK